MENDRLDGVKTEQKPRASRISLFGYFTVAIVGLAIFAATVIGNFRAPLMGEGDINSWNYLGYYLSENLHFTPLPSLDLQNDASFFPYGTNQVFLPWVIELAYFWWILQGLFGIGPWVQAYFLLSVAITLFGSFALLYRRLGFWRAASFSLIVAFGSYAAIWRFPGHVNMAIIHWTVLSLIVDFLLAGRIWQGERWSLRIMLVRILLLSLSLGQDLGYYAGVGITSLCLTLGFAAVIHVCREKWSINRGKIAAWWEGLLEDGRHRWGQHLTLVGLIGVVTSFYLPLAFEIAQAAKSYDFSHVNDSFWWVHPLRMLIPLFPHFNIENFGRIHQDSPEGAFSGTTGWFFILLALFGLLRSRRRSLGTILPVVILLGAYIALSPATFPLLRRLPWFSFSRVGGRFSAFYPTMLALIGLALPTKPWKIWQARLTTLFLAAVFTVEMVIAYVGFLTTPKPYFIPDAKFYALMNAIQGSPGEALLEWPFCIAGGNGVATGALCPFYRQQVGVFGFRAFHHKKAVSQYFGRIHPDQIQPFLRAGWPQLFAPDSSDVFATKRQIRGFLPHEWRFAREFFTRNDFCGVLLYTDLLSRETVSSVRQALGEPWGEADSPWLGHLEFYRKPFNLHRLVLPNLGRSVAIEKVETEMALQLDLTRHESEAFLGSGWCGPEAQFRWTSGKRAEVFLRLNRPGDVEIEIQAGSFQPQVIRVEFNSQIIGEMRGDGWSMRTYRFVAPAALVRNENLLVFLLPDSHSPASAGLWQDVRNLGAAVRSVKLLVRYPKHT